MNPVLIFQHKSYEGPGYLAECLEARQVPYRIVRVDQGEAVPTDSDGASGLVFMGGPMSVNDNLPWIGVELALIRKAQERDIPMLGHCLGGQLISKALGGEVTRNAHREFGWLPVERVEAGLNHPWIAGLPQRFEVFHWHGETFSIPEGAERVLGSDLCANQAFIAGKSLGLQCHPEMTEAMTRTWAEVFRKAPWPAEAGVQTADEVLSGLEGRLPGVQAIAGTLYARWMDFITI